MKLFRKNEIIGWILFYILFIYSPHGLLILSIILSIEIIKRIIYSKTTYAKQTNKAYYELRNDLGSYGEYLIFKYLKKYEKQGAKFLFNVYLPKNETETTEIDVLMISAKGIYVFESKNYSGWIFGSEEDTYWYQTLPQGRGRKSHKEKFYNPIKQNQTHIKVLKEITKNEIEPQSLIVFSERCEFKDLKVDFEKINLVYRFELPKIFKKIFETENKISEATVEKIYNSIKQYTIVSYEDKQKHIDNIKDKQMICPRCKSKLVERTIKQGTNIGKKFYGCSNYPKCKFTKNIDE